MPDDDQRLHVEAGSVHIVDVWLLRNFAYAVYFYMHISEPREA